MRDAFGYIHIAPVTGNGARKKTAFQLAQEFCNASPDHPWALVSNGRTLRLLRAAATLTRPSFLEIDLQDLLGGARYAEFANVWRLLHASRAPQYGFRRTGQRLRKPAGTGARH
ncbi:MAG: hypothetical protein PHO55_10520 [Thiomonas arsenitoxydans]|nr:hypothetical protein [Thiomonas arsenitoxydans]